MNRGSSWLPRLTARRPANFIDSIFFLSQTSTDRPRPRQWRSACSPRKRAVVTDGGSLIRSRARYTPGTILCAVSTDLCSAAVRVNPGLNKTSDFTSADDLAFERYLLN